MGASPFDRAWVNDFTLAQQFIQSRQPPAAPRVRPLPVATGALKVKLAEHDWSAFDRPDRIGAWDALAQWAVEPNPFCESWFLLASLRAFDPGGQVKLLALEADGQLAGLLPLYRARSYYGYPLPHLGNWLHANSFCGSPLVAPGFERAFWRELLRWCDRNARLALFLHLTQVPTAGPLHRALLVELAETPRPCATVHREERAMLASDLAPQAYFDASLTTKKRKELRRQHRRLAELGELTLHDESGDENVPSWIGEFLNLEHRGWKGRSRTALASDPNTSRLFAEALCGAALRGKLHRLALRLDGRPIAMLASFRSAPGAFSFKTAFDENYARFSPGVLLQRENLALLGDPAIAFVDSCAAPDHQMIDHFWRERRTIARHSLGIGGSARRATFSQLVRRETGAAPTGLVEPTP